jgi:hypothetical protein
LLKIKRKKQGDPLSPRRFPASSQNPLFSSAYVSMRCGRPVEAGGFRWNPEELDSYKNDYSENYSKGCQGWRSQAKGSAYLTVIRESGVRAGAQFYAIGRRISLNSVEMSRLRKRLVMAVWK